jgi:hypothetical protein
VRGETAPPVAAKRTTGIDAARAHGAALPRYENLRAARRALLAERDELLAHLGSLDAGAHGFVHDLSPDSLRRLERWYFALHRARAFARVGSDRRTFEGAMAYYLGAVAKRAVQGARWVVEAYPFTPGRYEIGIATAKHRLMLRGMCDAWHETPHNAREDALFRRFRETWVKAPAPRAPGATVPDGGAIAREIERLLARRSSPLLYPGELVTFVRHGLRNDKILAGEVARAAEQMCAKGLLEKVPLARKAGFRYRLASG